MPFLKPFFFLFGIDFTIQFDSSTLKLKTSFDK